MGWFSVIGFKLKELVNMEPNGIPHGFPETIFRWAFNVFVSTPITVPEAILDTTLEK
jgi:hypothetical protein